MIDFSLKKTPHERTAVKSTAYMHLFCNMLQQLWEHYGCCLCTQRSLRHKDAAHRKRGDCSFIATCITTGFCNYNRSFPNLQLGLRLQYAVPLTRLRLGSRTWSAMLTLLVYSALCQGVEVLSGADFIWNKGKLLVKIPAEGLTQQSTDDLLSEAALGVLLARAENVFSAPYCGQTKQKNTKEKQTANQPSGEKKYHQNCWNLPVRANTFLAHP